MYVVNVAQSLYTPSLTIKQIICSANGYSKQEIIMGFPHAMFTGIGLHESYTIATIKKKH